MNMKRVQWNKVVYLFVVLLMLFILPTGCGDAKTEQTKDDELLWGSVPEEEPGIAVDNDYMTFFYPQEWEGKVEVVREETDKNIAFTFKTQISDEEVALFSVVLGPEEADGYLLGTLEDAEKGTVNVYSVVNEQNPEDWSEEEYTEICRLQERVNDILVQLQEDERFVPTH